MKVVMGKDNIGSLYFVMYLSSLHAACTSFIASGYVLTNYPSVSYKRETLNYTSDVPI
jgi:hypothetical protein